MTMHDVASNPYAFTLGDRMKRSLKVAGQSRSEMAEYLGVAEATVSTWMNDRITPKTQTLRLWALRTGAPYGWLTTGEYAPENGPEPTGGVHPPGLEPGTHCFPSSRVIAGPWPVAA